MFPKHTWKFLLWGDYASDFKLLLVNGYRQGRTPCKTLDDQPALISRKLAYMAKLASL